MESDPLDRRANFIKDIVEVCKKYKVMIAPFDSDFDLADPDVLDIAFEEVKSPMNQIMFRVNISDMEEAIRMGVWSHVYGPENAAE